MMNVLRHEPRKSRIINAVSAAAMTPSRTTPEMADADEDGLVGKLLHVQVRR